MINHIRTLLMNRGRDGYAYGFPGEEFVDPSFVRRKLPQHLLRLHQALFGRDPDRLFLNYRLRQIMTLLHSTELSDGVIAADPRITYLPVIDESMFSDLFVPDAVQLGHAYPLYLAGTFEANEGLGLAQQVWRVASISPGTVQIEVQRPRVTVYEINYASTGGLTVPLTLPGSNLTVRFRNNVPTGTAWRVEAVGRPQTDFGQLLARIGDALGDGGISQLFPPTAAEPIPTYKRIWDTHPYFAYRFSALLLAAAAQINVAPQDLKPIVVAPPVPPVVPPEPFPPPIDVVGMIPYLMTLFVQPGPIEYPPISPATPVDPFPSPDDVVGMIPPVMQVFV